MDALPEGFELALLEQDDLLPHAADQWKATKFKL